MILYIYLVGLVINASIILAIYLNVKSEIKVSLDDICFYGMLVSGSWATIFIFLVMLYRILSHGHRAREYFFVNSKEIK